MVKESGERLFSDLLNRDDGVLASLLHSKGLNEMEAAVTIDRFIFEVRHELEQYGYCRLGEVGTLRIEPATKALRLYPPVQGEMPKQMPYIPKQVPETENEKREAEKENKSIGSDNETPATLAMPKKSAKPRKKVDVVMVVAIIILLVALLGIGYGWYVSNLGTADDDAAMDALRVTPGQTLNE